MIFYYNESTDPYYNLALEEYLFSHVELEDSFFMLWQNDNTIVIGRNQNAMEEINVDFVKQMNTKVVRRNTGGGAVYHDMGNINFTFIQNCESGQELDFSQFATPIIHALAEFGVKAECTGRNDLSIDGRKFSGTAQTVKNGRMLHHGTLLFNSDLNFIGQALTVKADKIESKGVKSVRSRITNISEYMQKTISMVQFRNQLMTSIIKKNNASPLRLSQENLNAIEQLCETKYSSWEWNYGTAPRYEIQKHRRFPSGGVTVSMSISRQGAIDNISIRGDFFGIEDISQLEKLLTGKTMKETALLEVLSYCNISDYISGITAREFADILLY